MSTNPHNDDKRLLELLERWHSGDFSRAHEQELQALADSDEFRREAVEGFWSLPETEHATHLASLRLRLRKRTDSGMLWVSSRRILTAVAAVAILVLSVIWLFPSAEKTTPMAQQEAVKSTENQPIASNLPEENKIQDETLNNSAPKLDRLGKSTQSKPAPPTSTSGPAASGSAAEIASAPAPVLSRELQTADKQMDAKPELSEAEYSKVVDEQDDVDQAPGNAAPRTEDMKEAPAKSRAKDAMKKQAPSSAKASQPAGGWSDFQDYLRRKARLPELARQNNISGSVGLKFRLDINNQPIDFQTLRPLGYGCDEEAVRLVKAYKWQRGSDPEVTVDVLFVR
jgi:protein TonB